LDDILLSINPYDPLWMAIAFALGLLLKLFGLPPLIGFLLAGFLLNALGAKSDDFLNTIADLGITLLLFSIGLKLRPQALIRTEVWGVASIHMAAITLLFSGLVMLLAYIGLPLLADLDLRTSLLVGFVLSFSSTVFAIKILDELGALSSKHGQVAIGVLVIQDIAAVAFLAVADGKIPSPWVITLLLLIPLRPFIHKLLEKSGHGELLVLFGIVIAISGANIFELVGVKGDVGALVFGMLLASHSKASELAKALLSFKNIFLVGFFLTIGMTALPGWNELLLAAIFLLFLPLKVALYFALFNTFFLRASTSWRAALNLANYSEFGLIVGAMAAASGWLPKEWLAVFAITLSLSFIVSAPLINLRDNLYQNWRGKLKIWERNQRLAEEQDFELRHIKVVIFGMGRMGSAAYSATENNFNDNVLGVEIEANKAKLHQSLGRNVIAGDATNPDFWLRAKGLLDDLDWVMLTLPSHSANIAAVEHLQSMGYNGNIAATSKFPDEEQELQALGVTLTFNIYHEAGIGFANSIQQRVT
jgi:glutathione-regulated potassium-efflux system ancillary protein KefC